MIVMFQKSEREEARNPVFVKKRKKKPTRDQNNHQN